MIGTSLVSGSRLVGKDPDHKVVAELPGGAQQGYVPRVEEVADHVDVDAGRLRQRGPPSSGAPGSHRTGPVRPASTEPRSRRHRPAPGIVGKRAAISCPPQGARNCRSPLVGWTTWQRRRSRRRTRWRATIAGARRDLRDLTLRPLAGDGRAGYGEAPDRGYLARGPGRSAAAARWPPPGRPWSRSGLHVGATSPASWLAHETRTVRARAPIGKPPWPAQPAGHGPPGRRHRPRRGPPGGWSGPT